MYLIFLQESEASSKTSEGSNVAVKKVEILDEIEGEPDDVQLISPVTSAPSGTSNTPGTRINTNNNQFLFTYKPF